MTDKEENSVSYHWGQTAYQIYFDLMIQRNMRTNCQRRVIRAE